MSIPFRVGFVFLAYIAIGLIWNWVLRRIPCKPTYSTNLPKHEVFLRFIAAYLFRMGSHVVHHHHVAVLCAHHGVPIASEAEGIVDHELYPSFLVLPMGIVDRIEVSLPR